MPFDHTSIIKTLCERWDLECLTARDRAAPSFVPVLSRSPELPLRDTPDVTPRPYHRLPEPHAHKGPLGHLGQQIVELSSAFVGEAVPAVKTVGKAVEHLIRHRAKKQSATPPDPTGGKVRD